MSIGDKDDEKIKGDSDYRKFYGAFSDTQQVKLLEEALSYIKSEVAISKDKLIKSDLQCRTIRKKIKELDK